jgi:thiamine-monophosphate kinase
MRGVARAAIDVSDGLARDASHLARASALRAVLHAPALLALGGDTLAHAASAIGEDALDLALHGGEDYALLAVADREIPGFSRIGECREGSGVVLVEAAGERVIAPAGFDHFT